MTNKKIIILISIIATFALLLISRSENLILNLLFGAVMITFVTSFLYNKIGLLLIILLRPVLDYFSGQNIITIGHFSLNLASLFGLFVILFCLFVIFKNKTDFKKIPLLKSWTIFLSLAFISIIFSINKFTSISETIRLSSILLIFLASYLVINNNKDLSLFIKTIIASAITPALFAFYQFVTNRGITIPEEGVYNRIFGTFSHPNLFAFYLLIPLSLCFIVFLVSNKKKVQIALYGLLSVFLVLALILTYTRGAWISFIIITLILGAIRFRLFLVVIVLSIILSYFGIGEVKNRTQEIVNNNEYSSVQWRINLWKDSVRYIAEKPLIGHGAGTAKDLIFMKRGNRFGSTHPHNDYLKIGLEMGVLGVLSYLFLLGNILLKLLTIYKKETRLNLKILVLVVLVLSFSIFIASFGDNIIRNTALQWSFWALIGGLLSVYKKRA